MKVDAVDADDVDPRSPQTVKMMMMTKMDWSLAKNDNLSLSSDDQSDGGSGDEFDAVDVEGDEQNLEVVSVDGMNR
ncbi:hypothetical protein QR98_0048550, partial [Sarcoptes scabiei]